jgi:hypothetical protein
MAHTTTLDTWLDDTTERRKALPELATARFVPMLLAGLVLVVATGLWWRFQHPDQVGRFWHAYLIAVVYFTSISLGGLFFVIVQHLTGAHWGVVVRRLGEFIAMGIGVCAMMWIPIWLSLLAGNASLYEWNAEGITDLHSPHYDVLVDGKSPYLNTPFFIARSVFFFLLWFVIARFYFRSSLDQDRAHDNRPMRWVRTLAGVSMLAFALSVTFASFDWMMTLMPSWFSTIFGVYYFAGCAVAIFAALSVTVYLLQARGILTRTVTVEHYHDLGKLLFGFIVFWAYIAFSQFMLIWYADLPEETSWYAQRQFGSSEVGIPLPVTLLFVVHFFIPFLGLLSRHVRRSKRAMAFWGVYMLLVHWFDLYFIVGMQQHKGGEGWLWPIGLTELLVTLGLGLVYVGTIYQLAAGRWLVPVRDPRLALSLNFKNH